MSKQEVYNKLYSDLTRAQNENAELKKQIAQQNRDLARETEQRQRVQYQYNTLVNELMQVKTLYRNAQQQQQVFEDYLTKLVGK